LNHVMEFFDLFCFVQKRGFEGEHEHLAHLYSFHLMLSRHESTP